MTIDSLPSLRSVIKNYKLIAKKSLGQNFLLDLEIANNIAYQAGNLKGRHVIEVGPGPGAITRALLFQGAFVTAIEYDERFFLPLQDIASIYPGKLIVIKENVFNINFSNLVFSQLEKPIIISNLPYNIGTRLFLNWILSNSWPPFYHSMILTFQKEVAKRIVAIPGNKFYCRLSVISGWRTKANIAFDISKNFFIPSPKVTSSVVKIVPKTPTPCPLSSLEKITKIAFNQRRKMIRQSLKNFICKNLLKSNGINGEKRAENLSIEEYITLAKIL